MVVYHTGPMMAGSGVLWKASNLVACHWALDCRSIEILTAIAKPEILGFAGLGGISHPLACREFGRRLGLAKLRSDDREQS
jgi:hypothetical protein